MLSLRASLLRRSSNLAGAISADYIFFNGSRAARVDRPSGKVHFFLAGHLGSARMLITPASSTTVTVEQDLDYAPYGVLVGGATGADHYEFTGKERDTETGLDNFGKRYDASSLGRFMTPDAFYKDSHVGDPQSWNEYAYARNNPLRYVDPTGETATVSSSCSTDANNHTTCNVNISASIAIYAQPGSNLSQDQLNQAAGTIQSSIQNAWSGSFTQDGVSYNVSTQVSVSVAGSQDAAMGSGAQNVIGISNGNASATADSFVNPKLLSPGAGIRGIETGVWNINNLGATAEHEFTHLLGVGDRTSGAVLSNTNLLNDPSVPHHATAWR
jgi:RHS repeat-associated protein